MLQKSAAIRDGADLICSKGRVSSPGKSVPRAKRGGINPYHQKSTNSGPSRHWREENETVLPKAETRSARKSKETSGEYQRMNFLQNRKEFTYNGESPMLSEVVSPWATRVEAFLITLAATDRKSKGRRQRGCARATETCAPLLHVLRMNIRDQTRFWCSTPLCLNVGDNTAGKQARIGSALIFDSTLAARSRWSKAWQNLVPPNSKVCYAGQNHSRR